MTLVKKISAGTVTPVALLAISSLLVTALPAQAEEISSQVSNSASSYQDYQHLTLEEQSYLIFPHEGQSQERQEFIDLITEWSNAQEDYSGMSAQALPAVLAPFAAALGACVTGSLVGTTYVEVKNLIMEGRFSEADERLEGAIDGCITGVIPIALRPVAKKASGPVKAWVRDYIKKDKRDGDPDAK